MRKHDSDPMNPHGLSFSEYCSECLELIDDQLSELKFAVAWFEMKELGACDSFGGVEFDRVSFEWFAENCPMPIKLFIQQKANQPPVP